MIRLLAKIWGKLSYRWKLETDAAKDDVNAGLADQLASARKSEAEKAEEEAKAIDENIEKETSHLKEGFWECSNGHEIEKEKLATGEPEKPGQFVCPTCKAEVRFLKLDELSGQDKYELEKELKDARNIADEKRKLAEGRLVQAKEGEDTAKHYRRQAKSGREAADRVKKI